MQTLGEKHVGFQFRFVGRLQTVVEVKPVPPNTEDATPCVDADSGRIVFFPNSLPVEPA